MKSLLFITRDSPLNVRSGGMVYAMAILDYFARNGWQVSVHWLNPVDAAHAILMPAVLRDGRTRLTAASCVSLGGRNVNIRRTVSAPLRKVSSQMGRFLKPAALRVAADRVVRWTMDFSHPTMPLFSKSPLEADPTPREIRDIQNLIQRETPELVILNYICLTPLLTKMTWPTGCKRAVLAHDVWHVRASNLRAAGFTPDIKEWSYAEERERYLPADKVIGISYDERPVFIDMLGDDKVATMPMAVEWSPNEGHEIAGRCLFVGTAMGVNVDAIRWFLQEIWPAVRSGAPEATLHVCGTACLGLDTIPDGVVLRGVVPDLEPEYAAAQVVVVPLRSGSGVKIKLAEAINHGKCCVATNSGISGMPAKEQSGIIVADKPEDFASGVVSLLTDAVLREHARLKMSRWAGQHLSPDAAYGAFLSWANNTAMMAP